jgi:hypothetical protein
MTSANPCPVILVDWSDVREQLRTHCPKRLDILLFRQGGILIFKRTVSNT